METGRPPSSRALHRAAPPLDEPAEEAFAYEAEDEGPPLRLRHLLLLLMFGGLCWVGYPRAIAAWSLHDQATKLADYALCMAGPTGPSLIRDNPSEFKRVLRRRLLSALPADRPFEACASLGRDLTKSEAVERLHLVQAWSFAEYGGDGADAAKRGDSGATLDGLRVGVKPLSKLAEEGWPFIRGGYSRLIKPSSTAKGAPHPSELPPPAVGKGLPSWRVQYRAVKSYGAGVFTVAMGASANLAAFQTRDGGVEWRSATIKGAELSSFAERCPAGDGRAYTVALDADGEYWVVTSLMDGFEPFTTRFAFAKEQLIAASCDEQALVAVTRRASGSEVNVALCPARQPCRGLALPDLGLSGQKPRYPMDIARSQGTTIIATTRHGIVRVASTRDDGKTWTPFTVAFDEASSPVNTAVKAPSRLLVLDDRLMLYGGAPRPEMTYPVLISKDLGASWSTP